MSDYSLKIRPAEPLPDKARLSLRLPEPTIAMFEAYVHAFEEMYGVEGVDRNYVANEILTSFFLSDRQFLKFVKDNKTGVVIEGTGKHRTLKYIAPPPASPSPPAARGAARDVETVRGSAARDVEVAGGGIKET